ncbi:hypothetical protein HPB52_016448 [Rhipicephalus sanguineus]|uniref:Carboxylesterase type B domain-containing protein n=1 Tax=Rhipicephalus sanguineus TaxID=34632 RepID=A0A9D4SNT2_RHISA|nr:hypothetical protein HPB52_016448 [Rhipicephalus sanguineus]
MKSGKAEDMANTTTSSYETAMSTLVSRKDKHKRSSSAREREIAAVMELIDTIERRWVVPPAGTDASLPVPQHSDEFEKEAPKPSSTKPEAEKGIEEPKGTPHDVFLGLEKPRKTAWADKEQEAKKEAHDVKSPDGPKTDDKKHAEEKAVQSKEHVVSSSQVQPQAGVHHRAPEQPPPLKVHPDEPTRPSKFYCAWIAMVLLALFAVTLALAMAVLGFVERQRNREHPVLKGVFGTVRGKRIVITDQGNEFHVYAFLGIPFAKPPLGTLRFKPPVPLDEEEDVAMKPQDREEKRPPCPQQDFYLGMQNVSTTNASEDCLHLNIWAPPKSCDPWPPAQGGCKLRPVLFFLYGAAFQNGANSFEACALYDGQYLSALGDLVVVVPNYRVGALGFLSGPSAGVLPGNAGLYDQRLALSWTLNNIENFGGNASRLVLAGHDAGAASLGYHLYKDDGVEGTRLLATNLQCGNDLSVPTALRCLQNSDVDAVARSPLASRFVPLLNRTPVARGPSSSADKRKEVGPQGKQFLLGRVVREGVYPWFVEHKRTGSSEPLHLATRLIGRKALEQWQTATGVTLRPLDGDTLYQQAVGDILEVCPMSDLAELLQVLENRVYVYVLGYRPRYSSWPDLTEAVRFEDMHLVFGMPFRPGVPSSELDKQWSRTMIQVWSTFAHTGKAPALNGSRWPVYDPLQPSYMKLGVDGVSMEHDAKRGRCDFLRSHRNTY